jgi:hypothetical protein
MAHVAELEQAVLLVLVLSRGLENLSTGQHTAWSESNQHAVVDGGKPLPCSPDWTPLVSYTHTNTADRAAVTQAENEANTADRAAVTQAENEAE